MICFFVGNDFCKRNNVVGGSIVGGKIFDGREIGQWIVHGGRNIVDGSVERFVIRDVRDGLVG